MEHPKAVMVRRGFEAFASGQLEAVAQILAPDVTWTSPGANALSGTYRGVAGVFEYFQKIKAIDLPFEMHDLTGSDTHVVALMVDRFKLPDGSTYDHRGGLVFRFDGDRICEIWAFNRDQEKYDTILTTHIGKRP